MFTKITNYDIITYIEKGGKCMKKIKIKILRIIALAMFISLACISNTQAQEYNKKSELIDINKCKITNENYIDCVDRDANILFNNQNLLPKTPIIIKGDNLETTTWQPNYKIEFGKPSFCVDLGAYYVITDISYYDTFSSPTAKAYQGQPYNWEEIGELNLKSYKSYKILKNNNQKATRYIKIEASEIQSGIAEIGIYGYKVAELSKSDIDKTGPKSPVLVKDMLTSGNKIGANAFCDDPYTTLAALGNIREYYSWNWVVSQNNKFQFNNVVNHDNYFKTLKEMNIDVIPCLQYTTPTLRNNKEEIWDDVRNYKPIETGANALDPMSYELHSKFMYNFAARYGNNKNVDIETLTVENGTEKLVGLGYLDSIESWNEQNKTWEGREGYFTPEEYAAMLSSDWDGHEGKIKNGGVKNADKNFKLVMGGLWWQGDDQNVINYLERMKTWFDYNRKDGVFCSDMINVHIGAGENPESGKWVERIKLLQNWIDENIPGTELWISEFDVDVTKYEKQGIDNHDNEEYEIARAQKLLRAYLIADKNEVDRLSMFMIRDTSYGVYYNSGLTTQKGEWDKKQSWYYISCATDTLKNADLIKTYENNGIYVYEYKDRNTSEKIYAIWSSNEKQQLNNCTLNVGNYQKATIVIPTDGIMEGEKETRKIENGKIAIDVNETVKFIKLSNEDVPYDNYPQKLINIQELRLGELNGSTDTFTFSNSEIIDMQKGQKPSEENFMLKQFYNLFDEQNEKNTPQTPWRIVKKQNKPTTEMGALAVHKDRAYPYDAIITFDDYYDITYIGLYDTYDVGLMEIYDENTGKLIYSTKLDTYDYWRLVPMTNNIVSTNKIRIVKYSDAKINELSFYGYKTNSKVGKDGEIIKGQIGKPKADETSKLAIKGVKLGEISSGFKKQEQNILRSFNFLFDEQNNTPTYSKDGVKQGTKWSTAFTNIWGNGLKFPYDGIIELENKEQVSKVGLWLGWGENEGKIEIYDELTGELLLSKIVEGRNKWVMLELDKQANTDKLKIIKYDTKPIYEISFYGK